MVNNKNLNPVYDMLASSSHAKEPNSQLILILFYVVLSAFYGTSSFMTGFTRVPQLRL